MTHKMASYNMTHILSPFAYRKYLAMIILWKMKLFINIHSKIRLKFWFYGIFNQNSDFWVKSPIFG